MITCSRCGRANQPHHKFCLSCGNEVGSRPLAPGPRPWLGPVAGGPPGFGPPPPGRISAFGVSPAIVPGSSLKNIRVFISSSFRDLQPYREAVFAAVTSLGAAAEDMVYWSADERTGLETSLARVGTCDVLVLVLAHRYGHVPAGESRSITEREYQAARDAGIPVLSFFVDPTLPWPPDDVEWERRAELAAFRARVEAEVTRKIFKSPDDLRALVTQALALFVERHARARADAGFSGRTVPLASPAELASTPDLCLHLGHNDYGLSFVAAIERSRPFDQHLQALAGELASSGIAPPAALIDSFKKALADICQESWSRHCIQEVHRTDGAVETMYVSAANLTGLFSPFLSRILSDPTATAVAGGSPGTGRAITMVGGGQAVRPIPSVGGTNRFLGISVASGRPFSVGLNDGIWVEWHPFFLEDVRRYFPGGLATMFSIGGTGMGPPVPIDQFASAAQVFLFRNASREDGTLSVQLEVEIARADILRAVIAIGQRIAPEHGAQRIHGDIKPANVLLTADQPTLIDSLALAPGDIAGAFTPLWSAPEQALGEPVQLASDVYSLALMTVAALQGRVFGEVRKYRSSLSVGGQSEFDLFHDPHVFFGNGSAVQGPAAQAYADLLRRSLLFDPSSRVKDAGAFSAELQALAGQFPVAKAITFRTACDLVVVKTPGGADVAAEYIRLG